MECFRISWFMVLHFILQPTEAIGRKRAANDDKVKSTKRKTRKSAKETRKDAVEEKKAKEKPSKTNHDSKYGFKDNIL